MSVFRFAGLAAVLAVAAPAQSKPQVRYADGKLTVLIPAADLAPVIDKLVSDAATGYQMNSDSKTAYIQHFRSSFEKDKIVIRFDYDAKTRGWTHGIGGKVYGPWAKDSGQMQVGVITKVVDWKLKAYVTYRDIHVQSNNWFTNWLMQDPGIEGMVKGKILEPVNTAIETALGGRTVDLKQLVAREGAAAMAAALGRPEAEVRKLLDAGLATARLDGRVTPAGVEAVVFVKGLVPDKVDKVKYTITNESDRTVKFTMQPSGKSYTLAAGKVFSGTSNAVNGKPPTIILDGNPKKYKLTAGDHKFWWMADKKRVGFDRETD
jgi:hypothetical protein